jgi:hypothetical protein
LDIQNLKKEDDPLWDEPKAVCIGEAFYKLEPLAYLLNNPVKTAIISNTGNCLGYIKLDIFPHDDDGQEFEEIPEDPHELVGQPLNFKVLVKDISGLEKIESYKSIRVEFICFVDNMNYVTKNVCFYNLGNICGK